MATKKKRPAKRVASKPVEPTPAERKLRTNTASGLTVSGRVVSDDYRVNGAARPAGLRSK